MGERRGDRDSSPDMEIEREARPIVVRNTTDLQRLKLEKLMKNPEKAIIIPERPKERGVPVVPDFVRNVMGSSAGAGSGEFHVYRHLRRKEYARQKYMKEKGERERLDNDYHEKLEENKKKAEERTAKKRQKRLKRKQKQKGQKKQRTMSKSSQSDETDTSSSEGESNKEDEEKSEIIDKEQKEKEEVTAQADLGENENSDKALKIDVAEDTETQLEKVVIDDSNSSDIQIDQTEKEDARQEQMEDEGDSNKVSDKEESNM